MKQILKIMCPCFNASEEYKNIGKEDDNTTNSTENV